jgi:hypothetical protein
LFISFYPSTLPKEKQQIKPSKQLNAFILNFDAGVLNGFVWQHIANLPGDKVRVHLRLPENSFFVDEI